MSLTIQCTEPASSQLLGTCGQAGATEAVEESAIGAAVLPTTEDEALAPGIVHCGICYEDHAVTDSVQLPCGHSFCWQRIAHWARNPTSHQPSCPVCRHLLIYQKCHHRPPGMFYHAGRRIPRHEFDGRCPPCRGVSWQLERHICTPEDMRVLLAFAPAPAPVGVVANPGPDGLVVAQGGGRNTSGGLGGDRGAVSRPATTSNTDVSPAASPTAAAWAEGGA